MAETAPAKKAQASSQARSSGEATSTPAPTESASNPDGQTDHSTGAQGAPEFIDAQEHVLGDDPRRIAHTESGFHDSLSGRPINERGYFTDTNTVGSEGPVPKHRIVANNWPQEREKIDDPAKREGSEA